MAEKRKRDDGAPVPDYRPGKKNKKQQQTPRRKGFTVGPANLPDGSYKRKAKQIKDSLIQKAKLKKDYAKVKQRGEAASGPEALPQPASLRLEEERQQRRQKPSRTEDEEPEEEQIEAPDATAEPTKAPHPDRQAQIDREAEFPTPASPEVILQAPRPERRERRERKPKAQPFKREHDQALRAKAEAEERRKAREEAERQRHQKIEERERFRKAMAKARSGGVTGQRKLGRESNVLLERVKRMVGEGG